MSIYYWKLWIFKRSYILRKLFIHFIHINWWRWGWQWRRGFVCCFHNSSGFLCHAASMVLSFRLLRLYFGFWVFLNLYWGDGGLCSFLRSLWFFICHGLDSVNKFLDMAIPFLLRRPLTAIAPAEILGVHICPLFNQEFDNFWAQVIFNCGMQSSPAVHGVHEVYVGSSH